MIPRKNTYGWRQYSADGPKELFQVQEPFIPPTPAIPARDAPLLTPSAMRYMIDKRQILEALDCPIHPDEAKMTISNPAEGDDTYIVYVTSKNK